MLAAPDDTIDVTVLSTGVVGKRTAVAAVGISREMLQKKTKHYGLR